MKSRGAQSRVNTSGATEAVLISHPAIRSTAPGERPVKGRGARAFCIKERTR